MKVLHISTSINPMAGGVSQAIKTMIYGLVRYNVINTVVTLDSAGDTITHDDNFTLYKLGPGKTSWKYASALQKWLSKNINNYDIIIVHGLWQYPSYATHKIWNMLTGEKPLLLVMPHGMLDPYFQLAKGRRLKAIRNDLIWKLLEKKTVNNADGLLFTSNMEKILARQNFTPYTPRTENIIGLGVELPPVYSEAMRIALDSKVGEPLQPYWLYISRIDKKKGIDLLIKSYLLLKKEFNNIPPLVIAGPGLETTYGQFIKQMAATDQQIYFPGMLTGDEKWGAFYGCEIFVLPSHQENFGIAVVEAMACSKPVIISDQINIWQEIIQNGGGIANSDTLDGTLESFKKWTLMPPGDKHKMGINAKTIFNNLFSIEEAAKRTFSVLKNYIN